MSLPKNSVISQPGKESLPWKHQRTMFRPLSHLCQLKYPLGASSPEDSSELIAKTRVLGVQIDHFLFATYTSLASLCRGVPSWNPIVEYDLSRLVYPMEMLDYYREKEPS